MLETFEKDDTDMQTSSPDFVPAVQYDSLRKEFEELQERYYQAQAATEASSIAEEPGYERLISVQNTTKLVHKPFDATLRGPCSAAPP